MPRVKLILKERMAGYRHYKIAVCTDLRLCDSSMAASFGLLSFPFIFLAVVFATSIHSSAIDDDKQVYIVYMGSFPGGEYSPSSHHISVLQEVIKGRSAIDSLVRSYIRSFNGFAARLSSEEVQKISAMKEVLSVFPSGTHNLQTTRSWEFMGLTENVKRNPTVESDIVIGVLDSGIWPESESFSDEGFGPPPKKWKGKCTGNNFTCNNKIIGARFYGEGLDSARDYDGHGTHTASTAAGNKVSDVSFYELAKGTARGGVPSARIAVYKVCEDTCVDSDILAGFDDAIADGVDIISVSFGRTRYAHFQDEATSIGAFHAMENGILTVQSAGNDGYRTFTTISIAPWIFSVAASSIDRQIISKIVLGNGKILNGNAVNSFIMNGTNFPLTYGREASSCEEISARRCAEDCLQHILVKDKIVLCESDSSASGMALDEVLRAGAKGAILLGYDDDNISFLGPLPSSSLRSSRDRDILMSYFNYTKYSLATILQSEAVKDVAAPVVLSYSSQGPNPIAPEILKPDITAPGKDILAAFPTVASPSGNPKDKRSVKYSFMSGTSVSCPHVTGAAAYVKTFHPDWSPSAIKSALMTTAWLMNATQSEFVYGSGHVNPVKAVDPGLVYEVTRADYIAMLCSMNITYFGKCPEHINVSPKDLNYPSMAFQVASNTTFKIDFPRTVRNVGLCNSTYKAEITSTSQVNVTVEPSILSFNSLDEKKSFVVTVAGEAIPDESMVSASLVWSDGTHSVRSPIVVFTYIEHDRD